jgi:hypothetical protein
MYLFDLIVRVASEVRADRAAKAAKKVKWRLAKQFNEIYTYKGSYFKPTKRLPGTAMFGIQPEDVAAWMCPECNEIHRPVSCSAFSGLQFPKCCSFHEGHRLGDQFATVT